MSLRHAILTALIEKPSSGLELMRRFDRSIGFFWTATHQQIYRELAGLEKAELIGALPRYPSRGQRKAYEVLPAGRTELAGWLSESQDSRPTRIPILLRLRAAAAIGYHGIDAEMQQTLEERQVQLAEYLAIEHRDFLGRQLDPDDRLRHLVLRAGVGLQRFWIDWYIDAIAEVRSLDAPKESGG